VHDEDGEDEPSDLGAFYVVVLPNYHHLGHLVHLLVHGLVPLFMMPCHGRF
jgi:hypothetical protein